MASTQDGRTKANSTAGGVAADSKLRGIVNASGFPLQFAVEQRIRDTVTTHGWSVVSREHAWSSPDDSGFADLVLARENIRLVLECKRVRDGQWIFLVPTAAEPMGRLRVHWADAEPEKKDLHGYHDFNANPATLESEFCVVRGTGEGDRPMLERIAWSVLASLPPLAKQEMELPAAKSDGLWIIQVPLIVTNASLFACRFDPAAIDLGSGDLSGESYEAINSVRFRKSLAHHSGMLDRRRTLGQAAANKERSILIVQAPALVELLGNLTVDRPDYVQWPAHRFRVVEEL